MNGTLCHRKRMIREKLVETWHEHWIDSMPTGGPYRIADQFPPRLGLSWQMKNLPRKIFGLVLQCRTGHAFMGEYAAHHRPGEDVSCPCGAGLQSRDHILQSCPRYEDSRHILQAVSSNIDTFRILGTKKGIKALSQFISKSGAFTKSGDEVLEVEEVVGG